MDETKKSAETNTDQSLALLGLASATWAHRLGNTLGIVRVRIQQIKDNLNDREKVLHELDRIQEVVEEQLQLINDLSGFSRLSASSGLGPVSVNSVITKTYENQYKDFQYDISAPKLRCGIKSSKSAARLERQITR